MNRTEKGRNCILLKFLLLSFSKGYRKASFSQGQINNRIKVKDRNMKTTDLSFSPQVWKVTASAECFVKVKKQLQNRSRFGQQLESSV